MMAKKTLTYFPRIELVPDIRRGEERLAAEVILAEHKGQKVPIFAALKAMEVLKAMAQA